MGSHVLSGSVHPFLHPQRKRAVGDALRCLRLQNRAPYP